MKKTGLLFLAVIALVAQPFIALAQEAAQETDPSEVFLKAYMTAQQAEKLERDNQLQPALAKLRFAGSLLEELKKSNADWQPPIVDYRSRKIAEAILRVESKISTQGDLSDQSAASVSTPEPQTAVAPAPSAEPNIQLGGKAIPSPETEAAIQSATKDLHTRIDALEADLKKARDQVDSAQREKSDVIGKLQESNSALEQAKSDLAQKTQAEQQVRDELAAAQHSLSDIKSSGSGGGTGNRKEVIALKGQITQLQKALDAAEERRTAAEKEGASAREKFTVAHEQVASLTKERDSMERERDGALKQLKAAGDAQARMQSLVAENADLQQRLITAVNTVREISADRPRKEQELHEVKAELEKLRDQLVASKKQNQDDDKTIADLRSQLDDTSGQLAAVKLNGATSEESMQLVKENQMLRGIVIRERQEEARREQAKKLMLAEFDKLKIKSDVLYQQIHLLAEPITKLSDEELELLKKPVVSISDTNPASIKAGLTIAKPGPATPQTPVTINGPTPEPSKTSLESVANGSAAQIGPEVDTGFKPGVPSELLPLAREAKDSFDHGKFKAAEQEYQEILAKSPNNLYSLSNLGVVYFRNGKLKAAELTLKKAIALAPADEFTHTTLGIVYYRQSKFDDALSELTKSLAINPKSATAHNYLGITASQKGWQEAAEKEMLEAIANNPDYADAHFNLAVVYSTSQPPAKELARRHYEKALALGAAPDPTLDKLLRR